MAHRRIAALLRHAGGAGAAGPSAFAQSRRGQSLANTSATAAAASLARWPAALALSTTAAAVGAVASMNVDSEVPTMVSAAAATPHPYKALRGKRGEDAHFRAPCGRAVGVFDGVGGWTTHGVDSGAYSRSLAHYCQAAIEAAAESGEPVDVLSALTFAYESSHSVTGTSTACVVSVERASADTVREASTGDGHAVVWRGLNVGDSGFAIWRRSAGKATPGKGKSWECVHRSKEQQHYFDCPFQLGTDSADKPSHGDISATHATRGDVVILGTDGLFDNLWPEDFVALLSEAGLDAVVDSTDADVRAAALQELADKLLKRAVDTGADEKARTPYGVHSQGTPRAFWGGKPDDVTVVVAMLP